MMRREELLILTHGLLSSGLSAHCPPNEIVQMACSLQAELDAATAEDELCRDPNPSDMFEEA